ncbi:uncharacterized protein LOC122791850 isoform X2 [Protopterus annectens]|uniref:uncharacterized protein LOC122791850 isoform X2 n=1 Tax=Protopterus annectens TaxID=7888 RepID=UPI001CFA6A2D|nr:uncharacterized protein LOC122791850 isoform X2 [Protopterus annectens]
MISENSNNTNKGLNFLLDTGISSGDDDDFDCGDADFTAPVPVEGQHTSSPKVDYLTQTKLPSPQLDDPLVNREKTSSTSIFKNPFKEEEQEHLSMLQKHVPLTVHDSPSETGGKKVCHMYQKNKRCRFGVNCKFAHDCDLQVIKDSEGCPPDNSSSVLSPSALILAHSETNAAGDGQVIRVKRKPGLSQTLIPPKRALKNFQEQAAKDRPWVLF